VTDDRLLTADEVAELFNVPASWVREHTRNGRIPSVPLGRYVRYSREDVLEWLAEQRRGGAAWRKHRPRVEGAATSTRAAAGRT
jgi:excisionase family DNA binding protein